MVRPVSLIQKLVAEHLPCTRRCNESQAGLPDTTKANTQEAGADEKESGLFADAGHLEDGVSHLKAHPLEDGGPVSQSPSLPLSEGRCFYKEEENRTKRSGEGVDKFSTCR